MATVTSDEYQLLTEHVGLLDRSKRGKLLLTGADVAEFLQGQLTNDVAALAAGRGCYAALLTHKGKLRADLRVLRGPDWCLLDTEPSGLAVLSKTVQMYSLGRDVKLRDETARRAILSLIGPAAGSALEVEPPEHEDAFLEGALGLYVRTYAGIDVICAADAAGAARTALDVQEVSESAAECVRIEAGRPRHGLDMDADTMPEEAGITARAVSFTKGCYVGQETVARLHYRGKPNRRLRGLRLSASPAHGDAVTAGERSVGRIGSACLSPVHGPIALAILRREVGPGDTVAVGEDGVEGAVVELPFEAVD